MVAGRYLRMLLKYQLRELDLGEAKMHLVYVSLSATIIYVSYITPQHPFKTAEG